MSIREKINRRYPDITNEQWHYNLWRGFWLKMIIIAFFWFLAGFITIFALVR